MTVYAIGATDIATGTEGSLDAEYADDIHHGDPALVFRPGDRIYVYIADAMSGATADGLNIVVPREASAGSPYTGLLRWMLHGVCEKGDKIMSTPNSGEYKVTDIRLDAQKHLVIKYDTTPA